MTSLLSSAVSIFNRGAPAAPTPSTPLLRENAINSSVQSVASESLAAAQAAAPVAPPLEPIHAPATPDKGLVGYFKIKDKKFEIFPKEFTGDQKKTYERSKMEIIPLYLVTAHFERYGYKIDSLREHKHDFEQLVMAHKNDTTQEKQYLILKRHKDRLPNSCTSIPCYPKGCDLNYSADPSCYLSPNGNCSAVSGEEKAQLAEYFGNTEKQSGEACSNCGPRGSNCCEKTISCCAQTLRGLIPFYSACKASEQQAQIATMRKETENVFTTAKDADLKGSRANSLPPPARQVII